MNGMIEQAARKLAAKHYALRFAKPEDDKHVLLNVDANWHTFAETATDVIKSIRESTGEVLGAIHGCYPDVPDKWASKIAKQRWQAAIDEILK